MNVVFTAFHEPGIPRWAAREVFDLHSLGSLLYTLSSCDRTYRQHTKMSHSVIIITAVNC